MKTAVIICAGEFPRKPYPLYLLQRADCLVCCDSAFATYLRRRKRIPGCEERLPDAVVGDLDSLSPQLQRRYASLLAHRPDPDDNDQTKAVQYILEQRPEVEEIHILGATGKRADHTVGNLSLLMEYPRRFELGGRRIDIVSDYGTAFALTDTATLDVGAGRRVSLFSPDNSLRIDSEGLVWPTGGVVFDNWWKATLNRAGADRITLRFSHPSRALVFLD